MSEIELTGAEIDYLLSPRAIRDKAQAVFEDALAGRGAFRIHADAFAPALDFVLKTIRKNYPEGNIPFHSRWGHFRAGGIDRVAQLKELTASQDPLERARTELDLVITSVLLDAGAGSAWSYREADTGRTFNRSEGLGVASFRMFLSGAMSSDRKSLRADSVGLAAVSSGDLARHFQAGPDNPLLGVEGRVALLNGLARATADKSRFKDGRPGNIIDHLIQSHGMRIAAPAILRAVLDGFGGIWPGRLSARGRNLGDVWRHSRLGLIPLHKLSQWMTYSLIEPIAGAGVQVTAVEELTGLAEYRNGGLFLDTGVLSLKNPSDAVKEWNPSSDLIIEWRALTVTLLDRMGREVCGALNQSAREFPLAKVLEGGTWWAGRELAMQKRASGEPPLKIESDGTVF